MSERKLWWVCATTMCLIYGIAGFGIGTSKMKHWQDEWYAAHPVVKEVPVEAPHIKARPLPVGHEGRKPTDIQGPIYVQYYDDGSFQFTFDAPPPKPKKQSKRPAICEVTDCSQVHTAQPIPEKPCDPRNLQPFCAGTDMLCENSYWDEKKGACMPFAEPAPREMAVYDQEYQQWKCPHINKSVWTGWQMSDDHVCTPGPPLPPGWVGDPSCTLGSSMFSMGDEPSFDDSQSDCVPESEKRRCGVIKNWGTAQSKVVLRPCEPAGVPAEPKP